MDWKRTVQVVAGDGRIKDIDKRTVAKGTSSCSGKDQTAPEVDKNKGSCCSVRAEVVINRMDVLLIEYSGDRAKCNNITG